MSGRRSLLDILDEFRCEVAMSDLASADAAFEGVAAATAAFGYQR
jgi:hypothetical protein